MKATRVRIGELLDKLLKALEAIGKIVDVVDKLALEEETRMKAKKPKG